MSDVLAGIPIYSKEELRDTPPELGQRYAVREKGYVRGPYEITWLQNGAYMGRAVHDVEGFPHKGPPEQTAVDPERMKEIAERKRR